MRLPLDNDEDLGINLAPMIDAVFLLLIFFLVATMLKRDPKTVEEISLAASVSSLELTPERDAFMVGIGSDGELFMEGELTSINAVRSKLNEMSKNEMDRRVRIDIDAEAPSYRVIELLDHCQFLGLKNVGLRTFHEKYDR